MIEGIQIGGHWYTIEFCDLLLTDDMVGQCDHRKSSIKIDKGLVPDQVPCILLHEILHAVDYIYNNKSLPEDVINSIGEGLWQVLQQLGVTFDLAEDHAKR